MKICDLCKKNPAIDAREVRTDSAAIVFHTLDHDLNGNPFSTPAYRVVRITKVKPEDSPTGREAETFDSVDACAECIAEVLTTGEVLDRV